MRQTVLMVLVGTAFMAAFAPRCDAGGLEALLPIITDQISGLWRDGEMELLGHYCNFHVKPTFMRFELYFQGSVTCPGWTVIRGEALTRSKSGVLGKTTKNFIQKALAAGLITKEDATPWLN